jgi:hypothetical protein
MSEEIHHKQHDLLLRERMRRKIDESSSSVTILIYFSPQGFIANSVLLVSTDSHVVAECQ